MKLLHSALLIALFSGQIVCENSSVLDEKKTSQVEACQEKKHAVFVNAPQKDKPIQLVFFHGLGRDPKSVEEWAKKEYENESKNVKVKVLNYNKIGLEDFEKELAAILAKLETVKDEKEKARILMEEEAKLLPKLRLIVEDNLVLILNELGDVPLENTIVVGYSMGGLVSSVFIEVLGNSGKGQVQSLLTSTAPPVGLMNCKLGVGEPGDGLSESTVFPWIVYSEIGHQDEIFINGVTKAKYCFSIFDLLDEDSKKHFTVHGFQGKHKPTEKFNKKLIKKAVGIATKRQHEEKNIPISLLS